MHWNVKMQAVRPWTIIDDVPSVGSIFSRFHRNHRSTAYMAIHHAKRDYVELFSRRLSRMT
jgi:hypothetical protein